MAAPLRFSVSGDRVRRHTREDVLAQIDLRLARQIKLYAGQPVEVIDGRLRELDEEWDVERVLETNASGLALAGVLLAATGHRKWLLLSGGVLAFLMQHALQGWCPPIPLLRKLGVRTQREIARERYALKVLRGDFDVTRTNEGDGKAPEAICDALRTDT